MPYSPLFLVEFYECFSFNSPQSVFQGDLIGTHPYFMFYLGYHLNWGNNNQFYWATFISINFLSSHQQKSQLVPLGND